MREKQVRERTRPVEVDLPCCKEGVKVTGRPSKQRERPRNHGCPKCGRKYRVHVQGATVRSVVEA